MSDAANAVERAARAAALEAARGLTFRRIAHDYLAYVKRQGRKPATIRDYERLLAEPGTPSLRAGRPAERGLIMAALGDRPASEITARQIREFLDSIADDGAGPRTVNISHALIRAIYFRAMQDDAPRQVEHNPAAKIKPRPEREPDDIQGYTPEEVESIARALAAGEHRTPTGRPPSDQDRAEDHQDAEAVRLAAYLGLRLGELLELRWQDVNCAGSKVTVRRNLSVGEVSTPKSGKRRDIPLSDPAAGALARLAQREDFTGPGELVICNHLGRHLDGSALRRRYKAARDAAGLRPLRWHDLRHSFGSRLVASGSDLVTVKSVMGHSNISTTERYLHARPATQMAAEFTAAFQVAVPEAQPAEDPEREALDALSRLSPEARARLVDSLRA